MKKSSLFFLSLSFAILIAYVKRPSDTKKITYISSPEEQWKTFIKNSDKDISAHKSTDEELKKGNLKRTIASAEKKTNHLFSLRENRVLTGENIDEYKDESVDLEMINKINPEWKDILGNELIRFQKDDTKVIIKDELHLINIKNGQGQYLEQVVITYFLKNGNQNSFRALVNSETGAILDTWDRTIHERFRKKPLILVPNNITGR